MANGDINVVNYQALYDLANDATKTIGTIDSASDALSQHIATLQSSMVGFGEEIPANIQKWKQTLDTISQNLTQTKAQIVQIAERAGVMVKTAQ